MCDVEQAVRDSQQLEADQFWDSLTYEEQCNAFHAVVQRIVEAELKRGESYRGVLYRTFDFGTDMYTRGIDCGFQTLHNAMPAINGECK